jgi:hypothetical protein
MYVPPILPPCAVFRPAVSPANATVIVLGAYRGGTSFIGECIRELGIPIGRPRLYPEGPNIPYRNYEDEYICPHIKELVKAATPTLWDELTQKIATQDAKHARWGLKSPAAVFIIDQLLPLLRNPHLIVAVRDVVAMWQSEIHHSNNPALQPTYFSQISLHAAAIQDLLLSPRAPTLAVSYERGKANKEAVKDSLTQFLNLENTP